MASESISRPLLVPPKRRDVVRSVAAAFLRWHAYLHRRGDIQTRNQESYVSAVCISDTHNTKPDLPDGDILLHAGDLSQYGTFDEIQNQLDWLNQQPHRWKVVIAGNHDLLLDPVFVDKHPDRELDKPGKSCGDLRWGDVIYLQNSAVRVEVSAGKKIKIFGSPWTPRFGNVAFQYDGDDHNIWEGVVPPDTDILLTHGPPAGHLDDDGKSCKMLLRELWRLQPRLVVFGHIHPGRGESVVWYGDVEASYERVICDQKPWVSLLVMAWSLLLLLLRYRPCPSSRLVNAAVLGQSREAIITSI